MPCLICNIPSKEHQLRQHPETHSIAAAPTSPPRQHPIQIIGECPLQRTPANGWFEQWTSQYKRGPVQVKAGCEIVQRAVQNIADIGILMDVSGRAKRPVTLGLLDIQTPYDAR